MEEIIDYFKACLAFHEKEYGPVINAVIHFDETTIHMAVASIPLTSGDNARLSAKDIMGGKEDYRRRQDRFYEEVGKSRGMERGESHDPENVRKHLEVQAYKKQQLEAEVERLQQYSKKLEWKNEKLQEINATLADQVAEPFLQFTMMEFIRKAKVKGEHGEIKSVMDGYNSYVERNIDQLREQWQQQFPPEPEEIREHEREIDLDSLDYEEWER